MANESSYAKFNVASALADAKIIKNVDKVWERVPGDEAVMYQALGGMSSTLQGLNAGYKYEFVKDQVKPRTITLTEDPSTNTTFTMSAFDAGLIQPGTMLYFPDGEVARVTANATSTTKTVERGFGASSAVAKATAASRVAAIGSPIYADEDTFVEKGKFRGDLDFVYPTIIHYKFGETALRSTQSTYVNKTPDEMAEEKQRLMIEKLNELEVMTIWGLEQQPTASNPGSFDGLKASITTNHLNAGNEPLTLTNLQNLIQASRRVTPNGKLTLFGGYTGRRIFGALAAQQGSRNFEAKTNEVGLTWETIHFYGASLDFVTVPIIEEIEPSLLLGVKKDDAKLHPIKHRFGSGWLEGTRTIAINNNLSEEYFTYNLLTFLMKREDQHFKVTNFSTDFADYPGII